MSDEDNIHTKRDGSRQSTYGKISADGGLSMEEAAELRGRLLREGDAIDRDSQLINGASRMLTSGQFEAAIELYQQLADEFPQRADDAHNGIGAALYFLGCYEEAISHYERALALGADPEMTQYNIEEARAAL